MKFRLLFGSSVINLPGETANHIEKASGDVKKDQILSLKI